MLFLLSNDLNTGEYRSGSGRYVGEFSNGTFQGQGTMHVKEGRFEGKETIKCG